MQSNPGSDRCLVYYLHNEPHSVFYIISICGAPPILLTSVSLKR